jgi:hypothetical protein
MRGNFVARYNAGIIMLINYIIRNTYLILYAIISHIEAGTQNTVFVDIKAEADELTAAYYKNAVNCF